MRRLLVIFCLLTSVSFNANAYGIAIGKPVHAVHQQLKIDSSKVKIRNFNTRALNKYSNDPEFNYHTDIKPESWWDRFWLWLWHIIENLFGGSTKSRSQSGGLPFNYILLVLLAGLLVYIITKFLGVENIFNRESKYIGLPYTESLENINEIIFDDEIEKAVTAHNYRLAVRLLYLRSLKQLNDAHLISWQLEKTNSAYLNEISDSEQKKSFGILTRQFEYVWYGDFPVDGPLFQNINASFTDFKKTLP